MILQATIAETLGDTMALGQTVTDIAEDSIARMNLLDMAVKGGWIMIVLAVLSVLCLHTFRETRQVQEDNGD